MKGVLALLIVVIFILAINPYIIINIYSNILGRLFCLIIIVLLAMNNVTLGLLGALFLIIFLQKYGVTYNNMFEGLDNMETPGTIGDDNIVNKSENKINVVTKSDLKNKTNAGVDTTSMSETIKAKPSNSIPVDKKMNSSIEVEAASEGVIGGDKLVEGFGSCALNYL
jgi:hypothetical protein